MEVISSMKIADAMKNLEEVKEAALEIKSGMKYSIIKPVVDFCETMREKLGAMEAYYGSWQKMSQNKRLTLEDISTETKRQEVGLKLLSDNEFISRIEIPENFIVYEGWKEDAAAINSKDVEHYKQLMSESGLDKYLDEISFTPCELCAITAGLPEEKDYVEDLCNIKMLQEILKCTKLNDIEAEKPIEYIYKNVIDVIKAIDAKLHYYHKEMIALKIRETEAMGRAFAQDLYYGIELTEYKQTLNDTDYKMSANKLSAIDKICNLQLNLMSKNINVKKAMHGNNEINTLKYKIGHKMPELVNCMVDAMTELGFNHSKIKNNFDNMKKLAVSYMKQPEIQKRLQKNEQVLR